MPRLAVAAVALVAVVALALGGCATRATKAFTVTVSPCLLYTSDAADE